MEVGPSPTTILITNDLRLKTAGRFFIRFPSFYPVLRRFSLNKGIKTGYKRTGPGVSLTCFLRCG